MKKWLGIFIRNENLCSQVNAGVHRTYSMFVMILEKSPNFEDRGGGCSPPLYICTMMNFINVICYACKNASI